MYKYGVSYHTDLMCQVLEKGTLEGLFVANVSHLRKNTVKHMYIYIPDV